MVKARLILHFDINKTVLMSDKAQGTDTDHMVNQLLSECAWGRLEPGPKWVPVGRLATDRCGSSLPQANSPAILSSCDSRKALLGRDCHAARRSTPCVYLFHVVCACRLSIHDEEEDCEVRSRGTPCSWLGMPAGRMGN